ncbi:ankyrin repeat domain-containing protein [Marinobacter sp.]|uniref:ankyrin repeat domain-containing protein n=1 Tax=Marinobacter sp. TaxID=50741 RepID=UPI003564C66F
MPRPQKTNCLLLVTFALVLTACAAGPTVQERGDDQSRAPEVAIQKTEPGKLSPVIQAIMDGDAGRLRLILEQGGNPNASEGLSALSTAIVWGRVDMVDALINAGASINKPSPVGTVPIHWASGFSAKEVNGGLVTESEQIDIIRRLIEQGANVNARDGSGATPLFWAAEAGADKAVSVLLDAGAQPGVKTNVGTTAAIAALEAGHSEVAAMLRDRAPTENAKTEHSNTTLAEAILSGDLTAVKAILASKPDLAVSRSKRGYTPIILALTRKQTDIAMFFAKTYPDSLAIPGQSDWTPLHFVFNSHKEFAFNEPERRALAKAMANNGAPLEAQTDDGMTPLLLATYNAMPDGVEVLLKAGADPDYRAPGRGVTPLMVSAVTDLRSMELLLSNGANVGIKDAQGRTALHYLARGSESVSQQRAPALAEMLISSGASINEQDAQQETALMVAARYGRAEMAETLMENGADPTLRNNRGETAEFIALVENHYPVIEAVRQRQD